MEPDFAPLKRLIEDKQLPVREQAGYLSIILPAAEITVQRRPTYCDRGRFLVNVWPRTPEFAMEFDSQDGFPRYYFDVHACAEEIYSWVTARGLLSESQTDAEYDERDGHA